MEVSSFEITRLFLWVGVGPPDRQVGEKYVNIEENLLSDI